LPPVELLDMKGQRGALHTRSIEALSEVKREGSKAIVLLNRRGWSNFLSCGSCGHVWSCPSCDVTLVLHRADGVIGCHHCGYRESVPTRCSECGSSSVSRHGAGTERIESEIAAAVGSDDFPVIRLDADSASRKGSAAEILKRFQSAQAGVLIGTQMVAKGHDFPDVTLGIVIDADSTLRFPDFRSEERTFQLVTQLAGRAGRGALGGNVLVQTNSPDARVLELAARHDSDSFIFEELERRDALRYPPAAALVRIQVGSESLDAAEELAIWLAARLESVGLEVLGPAELFRLRDRHRRQLVARSADRDALVSLVDAAVAEAATTPQARACSIGTEVDAG
jgi:primosomal protein N' (replication factor Y)